MRLDTTYVAKTAAEALAGARVSEEVELGPEWAAENELIGVAEVDLRIVALHPVAELAPAGVA